MAIGTENYPNTASISAAYPNGGIKDDTGLNDGTPVNKLVYDDIHQTFRKFLRDAGITPTNTPDNVTNGFQYSLALDDLYKNYNGFSTLTTSTSLGSSSMNKIILCNNTSPVTHTLPQFVLITDLVKDGDTITFINIGTSTVNIIPAALNTILNSQGQLKSNDYIQYVFDVANSQWIATFYKIAPLILNVAPSDFSSSSASIDITGTTMTTPNDGITRKWLINFKCFAEFNHPGGSTLNLLETDLLIDGVVVDYCYNALFSVGTVTPFYCGTLATSAVATIAPNKIVKLKMLQTTTNSAAIKGIKGSMVEIQ